MKMFGLPSLQIYGLQADPHHHHNHHHQHHHHSSHHSHHSGSGPTKVATQIIEKFIKSELITQCSDIKNGYNYLNNNSGCCNNNSNSANSSNKSTQISCNSNNNNNNSSNSICNNNYNNNNNNINNNVHNNSNNNINNSNNNNNTKDCNIINGSTTAHPNSIINKNYLKCSNDITHSVNNKATPTVCENIYNKSIMTNQKDFRNSNQNGRVTGVPDIVDRQNTSTTNGHGIDFDAKLAMNDDRLENGLTNQVNAEPNVEDLKGRLNQAELNLEIQKRKYIKAISFLNRNNQYLEDELAKEKRRRAEELSRIVKSLLCFEAKLRNDKKVINQQLYEKDIEIGRLSRTNKGLREKLQEGEPNEEVTVADNDDRTGDSHMEAILFCPNCQKDYYRIEGTDVWTQTQYDGRSSKDDHTENGSSSDETLSSSFYGARRSIRYTSKRTFGTFRDYMRSRSMSIDDPSLDNSEENASTLSRDESHYSCAKVIAYSKKIDRLHGIRKGAESCTDDAEVDSESDYHRLGHGHTAEDFGDEDIFFPKSNMRYKTKKFAEISPNKDFEASTDDWYASASDIEESENVRAKPYGCNAVNPVLECVNQILLQQSMEETMADGPPSLDSSENNSGSGSAGSHRDHPVSRKRVHFSTKNSMVHVPRDDASSPTCMDDSIDQKDSSLNYESIYSNEYEPIGSEQNSSNLYVDMESKLGQEDRMMVPAKTKQPPALPPKPANLMKFKRVLRVVPQAAHITQKHEDQKSLSEERTESEPHYCSISEVNESMNSLQIVADVHKGADEDTLSSHSDVASQKTEDREEIFADVPKLPNVAAIIAPKAINKFISNDNYITKSPSKEDNNVVSSPKATNGIPSVLAEINGKKSMSSPTSPTKSVSLPTSLPNSISKINSSLKAIHSNSQSLPSTCPPEEKLPLEAEFDWYNLDAEYGKSNQPDVIKETEANNLEYHHENLVMINEVDGDLEQQTELSIEYNLDEEFTLANQPDIIKENSVESPNSTDSTEPATTVCSHFPTIVDQTPCNQKLTLKKNFATFIEGSGLITKPLPRQRKIYFSGPFV